MLHRVKKENDIHRGKWNGLGGKLFPGESPEDCVVREVREESGLRLIGPRFRGFITFPGFDGEDDWYVWVFTATRFTGRLVDSAEGVLRWVPNREIPRLPLWAGDRIFMKWLNRRKTFLGTFVYRKGRLGAHRGTFY
jgi:8-oxo-dGTP diphosphatase